MQTHAPALRIVRIDSKEVYDDLEETLDFFFRDSRRLPANSSVWAMNKPRRDPDGGRSIAVRRSHISVHRTGDPGQRDGARACLQTAPEAPALLSCHDRRPLIRRSVAAV